MTESPITKWLDDVSRFDVDAAVAALAPDAKLLSPDGRRAQGADAIRSLITEVTAELRGVSFRVTAEWQAGDTWVAELAATYELRDYAQIGPVPRAVIARVGADGIADLRIYGAHEGLVGEHRTGGEGMWVGRRWIPPL
jgi:hypothetical protein